MDSLGKQVHSLYAAHLENILRDISSTYNLDTSEILEKWGPKKKTRKSSKSTSDTPAATETKRGRKKKEKDVFIETEEYTFEGVTYLVDRQNNVYTNNPDAPALVGSRLVDGTVKLL